MAVLSWNQIYALSRYVGLTDTEAITATSIPGSESGRNADANGDLELSEYGSVGLWQIFTGAHSPTEVLDMPGGWDPALVALLKDPFRNAHAMWVVSNGGTTWHPWSTYQDGAYKAWTAEARAASAAVGDNFHAWLPGAAVTKPQPTGGTAPSPGPNPIPQPLPGSTVAGAASRDYLRLRGNKNPLGLAAVAQMHAWHNAATKFPVGRCQEVCREAAHAPFAGRATAQAEWLASPRRHGWYNPPVGVPVHWSGGSQGAGHVAWADGFGNVWSTDIRRPGMIDLVPIAEIHTAWGLKLEGWTETMSGLTVYA